MIQNEFNIKNIKLIVGLGNIGRAYDQTRHNIGFEFVDFLANSPRFVEEKKFKASLFEIEFEGQKIRLAKPTTMMNASGDAVQLISNFYKIDPDEILVVHDDLDLTIGNFKIQFSKGPRIHNGILSIENHLGTEKFWRLRIGVDNRTQMDRQNIAGADYVLGKIKTEDIGTFIKLFERIKFEFQTAKRNNLTDIEDKTVRFYDRTAGEWSETHNTKHFWGSSYDKFKEIFPKGNIIEIGAGSGRDAQNLIEDGYTYLGTDISKGLLKVAQKKNPSVKFIQTSVYDLPKVVNEKFDAFWASAVLLHIPKNKINSALQSIKEILKDGGVGFISLKEGEGEEVKQEDEGERLFSYYKDSEFRKILNENNFKVLYYEYMPMTEKTKWLVYIVKSS